MKTKLQIISCWCFAAPLLLLVKTDVRWYVKLLLVLLSPFTFLLVLFIDALFSPSSSSSQYLFEDIHQYKSADDISKITHSYIPPCDTVGALHHIYGLDYAITEKFYMKQELTPKISRELHEACATNKFWTETDSTFEYMDSGFTYRKENTGHNDYFSVTIPKKGRLLYVEYGDF